MLIANLDRSLSRRAPAEDAAEVLQAFPDGLTTAEVAQIMTQDKYAPDLNKAEDALIAAIGEGAAQRLPFGHDALWVPERARRARPGRLEKPRAGPTNGPAPQYPYGVVVDSVKVSVLLYVPVRSASLALTGCLKPTVTASLDAGAAHVSSEVGAAEPPTGA